VESAIFFCFALTSDFDGLGFGGILKPITANNDNMSHQRATTAQVPQQNK
jgi:hypothetical protein